MTITVASFKVRFPSDFDYTSILDSRIELFISLAELETSEIAVPSAWVDEVDYQLTAHLLTTEEVNSGTAEPQSNIASKSVGDMSVSFSGNQDYYSTTKYGERYRKLLSMFVTVGPMISGVSRR